MIDMRESNPYGELDESRLLAFEETLGCELPSDYRVFLMAHNGGTPKLRDFVWEEDRSCLHVMYGLHAGPPEDQLDRTRRVYRGRIPSELTSVGCDPGGNEICIGLVGDRRGRVYFWDHETGDLYELAASFADFLAGLHEWEDPDEHPFVRMCRKHDLEELQRYIDSGLDLDTLDEYDRSLLEYATMFGHLDMVKRLANAGASLRNALKYAKDRDNADVIAFLEGLQR